MREQAKMNFIIKKVGDTGNMHYKTLFITFLIIILHEHLL